MGRSTYIRVRWHHAFPDEPIEIWSELDEDRFETRKMEFFRNGSVGYASLTETAAGARLGDVAFPVLDEIASDPQFDPEDISGPAFEKYWTARRT